LNAVEKSGERKQPASLQPEGKWQIPAGPKIYGVHFYQTYSFDICAQNRKQAAQIFLQSYHSPKELFRFGKGTLYVGEYEEGEYPEGELPLNAFEEEDGWCLVEPEYPDEEPLGAVFKEYRYVRIEDSPNHWYIKKVSKETFSDLFSSTQEGLTPETAVRLRLV